MANFFKERKSCRELGKYLEDRSMRIYQATCQQRVAVWETFDFSRKGIIYGVKYWSDLIFFHLFMNYLLNGYSTPGFTLGSLRWMMQPFSPGWMEFKLDGREEWWSYLPNAHKASRECQSQGAEEGFQVEGVKLGLKGIWSQQEK